MSPGIMTSFPQSATWPCLFPNSINNSNLPPITQQPSTVYPGSYVGNTHITQHTPLPVSSLYPPLSPFVPYRTNMDPNIQIKKMSLPTFSGQRKDWPEFKAVWKSVAETVYTNKTTPLGHELKRSLKGKASKRIRSVHVTKPEAYDLIWRKLESYYEDVGASVQAALEDIHKLKAVTEGDYKGLVELIDETELAYSQLEELGKLNILTMRDVDMISELLPSNLKAEWRRKYRDMSPHEKVSPFVAFMKFLDGEREAVSRVAEAQVRRKSNDQRRNERRRQHGYHVNKQGSSKYHKCAYPSHRKDAINHTTAECKEFQKLPTGGKNGKYELLKQTDACFKCFGNHRRSQCPKTDLCACGSNQHHRLLCDRKDPKETTPEVKKEDAATRKETHVSQGNSPSLYPIYQATVCGNNKSVSVFCDGGSKATYITHRAADKIRAKKLGKITLDVTTMGNIEKTDHTQQYEFTLRTKSGRKVTVTAYGMDQITGPVNKLDYKILEQMFPEYDPESLQRKSNNVDVLLGCDFFGLHPKKEEARYGEHLSVMSGELGICLQGTHPGLTEATQYDSNLAKVIHVKIRTETYKVQLDKHPQFRSSTPVPCLAENKQSCKFDGTVYSTSTKREENRLGKFIEGEEMGTETNPRCGSCRCGKCPVRGHTYSFKEEQELKIIQENLEYDEQNQCWRTSYPWILDPSTLPDNYNAALSILEKTERTLQKDERWAATYKEQMNDMVQRKVARQLMEQEVLDWKGPKFYISHLAVVNPKSSSTPVRIVFNSSQVHKGVSLNSCLAKGPDSYMNNVIGVLLRWREEAVALVGDIRKMFNSVY